VTKMNARATNPTATGIRTTRTARTRKQADSHDEAQLNAWAPSVPDAAKWLPTLTEFDTYLAIDASGDAVAWIAMTPTGYIDMQFCLPEVAGRGAAGQLYETVERLAKERGLSRMTAHASLLAQPFFAKRGWRVENHEMHVRNGVGIPRAEMSKELIPQGAEKKG
jgi:putative acetyltransferase